MSSNTSSLGNNPFDIISSLSSVLSDLRLASKEFTLRGLKVSSKFCLEFLHGSLSTSSPYFENITLANGTLTLPSTIFFDKDDSKINDVEVTDVYQLARAYFDERQFLRASTLLEREEVQLLASSSTSFINGGTGLNSGGGSDTKESVTTPIARRLRSSNFTSQSLSGHMSQLHRDGILEENEMNDSTSSRAYTQAKRRMIFLRLYSKYLDGEIKKEAERAQGGDSLARTRTPTNPTLSTILAELLSLDDKAKSMAQEAKNILETSSSIEFERIVSSIKGGAIFSGSVTRKKTAKNQSERISSPMSIDGQVNTSIDRVSFSQCFDVYLSSSSSSSSSIDGLMKEKESVFQNQPSWSIPGKEKRDLLMKELPQWHASILTENDFAIQEAAMKKRIEGNSINTLTEKQDESNPYSIELVNSIISLDLTKYPIDGYLLWLLGVVFRELDRLDEARNAFLRATRLVPLLWSAWADLASVCSTRSELESLKLPNHWMAHIFKAHALLELQASSPAALQSLQPISAAFPRNSFLKAMAAKALYNLRRIDQAQALFESIRLLDPQRIEDMDVYSNILYVKGETARLATLAHELFSLDRFTPQACCVVGNYFSARREHEKAVLYFRRCLRLNPQFLSAWTLMGHEYVEMKNTAAAIECYRRAVDANSRDYRAWYGLGQTYELLQMYLYASYYYRRACSLRPKDARMWCALGTCFESLERKGDAIACFERAALYSDRNGIAALRLARLYRDSAGNISAACKWFAIFIEERENVAIDASSSSSSSTNGIGGDITSSSSTILSEMSHELSEALLFLAKSAWDEGRLGDAETFAARVLSSPSTSAAGGKEARVFLNALRTSLLASEKKQTQGIERDKERDRNLNSNSNPQQHQQQVKTGRRSSLKNSSTFIGKRDDSNDIQTSSLLTAAPRGRNSNTAINSSHQGQGQMTVGPAVATTPTPQGSTPFPPPQAGWLNESGISLPSPLPSGAASNQPSRRFPFPTTSSITPTTSTSINTAILGSDRGGGRGGGREREGGGILSTSQPLLSELEPGILEPSPALSRGVSFTRGSASGTRRIGGGGGGGLIPTSDRGDLSAPRRTNLSFEPLLVNSPPSMDISGGGGGGGEANITAGTSPVLQGIDATISLDLASPSIALSFGSGGSGRDGSGEGGSGEGMDVDESN